MQRQNKTNILKQKIIKKKCACLNNNLIIILGILIRRYGLNYEKFQTFLFLSQERIHFLIFKLELLFPRFLKKHLKIYQQNLFSKNQNYLSKNGVLPLEFFLANF
jgi:hypothetical protein